MRIRPRVLVVSAALVAAGLAWLTSASASNDGIDDAPQVAQAPPAGAPPMTGIPERDPHHRGMMARMSPRALCEERIARRAGARAYLKEKLNLKPNQMPAWDAFQKAADAASAQEKARCATRLSEMPKAALGFADRLNRREEGLKSRLEDLTTVKPALLALYDALEPEQRDIFDPPARGYHGDPDRGRNRFGRPGR
jgi:hypothetical protein